MLKISHGILNQQIKDKLEGMGYSKFHELLQDAKYKGFSGKIDIEIEFIFESNYHFIFDVEIQDSSISKQNKFTVEKISNKNMYEFIAKSFGRRKETLQDWFDKYYAGYQKWLYDTEEPLSIMNDYKDHM